MLIFRLCLLIAGKDICKHLEVFQKLSMRMYVDTSQIVALSLGAILSLSKTIFHCLLHNLIWLTMTTNNIYFFIFLFYSRWPWLESLQSSDSLSKMVTQSNVPCDPLTHTHLHLRWSTLIKHWKTCFETFMHLTSHTHMSLYFGL